MTTRLAAPDRPVVAAPAHPDTQLAPAELIESYLPLAQRIAQRYAGRGEPVEDLVQVATVGLIKAARRYDPERGTPFPSYAIPTMVGELRRHFRDMCWAVRVPRGLQELSLRVQGALDRLTRELGRSPTTEEVAQEIGVSADEVLEALETSSAYSAVSLDAPVYDEDMPSLGDQLGEPEGLLEQIEARESVKRVLASLPARERRILTLRFFGGRTQAEIAREMGISQMHVSRLIARTLARLRDHLVDEAPLPAAWSKNSVVA